MKAFCFSALLLFCLQAASAQTNIRLAKEIYKGNDFSQVTEYKYAANGRIEKIILSQNGKRHYTITDFVFNDKGLLVSYIITYNLKISPQKTTITYDAGNRVSTYITAKTKDNSVQKSKTYSYKGKLVEEQKANYTSKTVYTFDEDSNIVKIQSTGNTSTDYTNLYNKYDASVNPNTLLGGFVDEKPMSKHNSLEDVYVNIYTINRKIEYEKKVVSANKPGGAKIPTQYKNGLPLKITETSFDKAYNKVMPVSTTTYQYIVL